MVWSSGERSERLSDLKLTVEQIVVEITGLAKMFQDKGLMGIRRVHMKKL